MTIDLYDDESKVKCQRSNVLLGYGHKRKS